MNLFNYLMTKKGHNTSVRDDLFAYLLGKRTPKEIKTATGTTISISDATREKIVSLTLSKESTQDGTPTPESPVEVKTVKGNVGITITDGTNTRNYTIPLGNNEIAGIGNYKDELIVDKNGKCWLNKKTGKVVLDGSENRWLAFFQNTLCRYYIENFLINSIDNLGLSNYFTKGQYSQRNNTDYITNLFYIGNKNLQFRRDDISTLADFKTWLSAHNTEVYYVLATENLIDLNYTVDLTLFKGVNNISNSDDMDMTLKYY